MPGAPNRPLEPDAPVAPPPTAPVDPARSVVRRLAPARVALRLDLWKNLPSAELTTPFHKAEACYAAGDYPGAVSALDLLSVRFAEPRWPTLPVPFRDLRVAIPAPMPPSWNPDFKLAPADLESKRVRRFADLQLALSDACVQWAAGHAVDLGESRTNVETARALLGSEGPGDAFWSRIDAVWDAVRTQVPAPAAPPGRSPPVPPPQAVARAEEA